MNGKITDDLFESIIRSPMAKCLFAHDVADDGELDHAADVAIDVMTLGVETPEVLTLAAFSGVPNANHLEVRHHVGKFIRSLGISKVSDTVGIGLYIVGKLELCDSGEISDRDCMDLLAGARASFPEHPLLKRFADLRIRTWGDDPEDVRRAFGKFQDMRSELIGKSRFSLDAADEEGMRSIKYDLEGPLPPVNMSKS